MIILKGKPKLGEFCSQNHLADEQSEIQIFPILHTDGAFNRQGLKCPNSWFFNPLKGGESLTHWKRTREGAPIEYRCTSGSQGFGVSVPDTRLFTSAAQGSCLWSSENQESRKCLYLDAIDMGLHPERF